MSPTRIGLTLLTCVLLAGEVAADGGPLVGGAKRSGWLTRFHRGVAWHTTDDPKLLDAEVARGAVILRYVDGSYVHAIHRQYPSSCGPSTLAMVLLQQGLAHPEVAVSRPRDVDSLPGDPGETVSLGYAGSMEHILWHGWRRRRLEDPSWVGEDTGLLSPEGLLNVAPTDSTAGRHAPNGEMAYLGLRPDDPIPTWLWRAPGLGSRGDPWWGLPGIMNYVIAPAGGAWADARSLGAFGGTPDEVLAFRRIVAGYVDHGLSLVLGVESGGHFNALIGYRGDPEDLRQPFHVYTAEPLDGWGRPAERLPLRWRRIRVTAESLREGSGLLWSYIGWNQHLAGGCDAGGWATEVDRLNGNDWLTVPAPEAEDHLRDGARWRP